MTAFLDARCPCGKKIGWAGKVTDRPFCPDCGYRPPQWALEQAQLAMEHDERMLLELMENEDEHTTDAAAENGAAGPAPGG